MNKIDYPISKSQLQNGYELKKEINEKLKKEFLEKYIKEQVDLICLYLIDGTIDISLIDISKESKAKIRNKQKYKYEFIHPIGIEFKNETTYTFVDLLNTIFINGSTSHNCNIAWRECKKTFDFDEHGFDEYVCRIISGYHIVKKLDICSSKALFYTKDKLITVVDCMNIKMEFFNEIQKRFPDSIVEMNSDATYITIDWND